MEVRQSAKGFTTCSLFVFTCWLQERQSTDN